MNKLVFISKNAIDSTYASLLTKYRTYKGIMDIVKIWLMMILILFFMFIYLYFVNKSSTQWYFLRLENNNLYAIKFQYEIVKTHILNEKQQNREQMHNDFWSKDRVVDVSAQVINIPKDSEIPKLGSQIN